MLKKIKDILGIEGVKLALEVAEEYSKSKGVIEGTIVISSQSTKTIKSITLSLIEKYGRGRKDEKLINEYLLGSIELDSDLTIEPDKTEKIDFVLPYNLMLSEMDQLEKSNFLLKPFVKLAKTLKNVKSDYKIKVSAQIKGTKLDAVAEQKINLV